MSLHRILCPLLSKVLALLATADPLPDTMFNLKVRVQLTVESLRCL